MGRIPPGTIQLTKTGTEVVTCSGLNLPPNWAINATSCSLINQNPIAVQGPVPAGCTVTATNAWGSNTQNCLVVGTDSFACEANWKSTPFLLSQNTFIHPKAPTAYGLFSEDTNRQVKNGISGSNSLTVSASNSPNKIDVVCNGGAQATVTNATIDPVTGQGSANVKYTRATAITDFLPYDGEYFEPYRLYDPNNPSHWGYTTIWPRLTYSVPNQSAVTEPANAMCSVTVTNTTTGVSNTCDAPATPIVDNTADSTQSSCSVNLYGWTKTDFTARYSPSVPFDSFGNNDIYGASLNANGFLPGPGVNDYSTPNSTGTYSYSNNFVAPLTCHRRVVSAADPLGTWQPVTLGNGGGPTIQRYYNNYYNSGQPVTGTSVNYFQLDTFNAASDDYDLKCEYTATAYNPNTDTKSPVSCSAFYQYRTGAKCELQIESQAGPSGVTVGGVLDHYDGYVAGYAGKVRFLGEKVVHTSTKSDDRIGYIEPSSDGGAEYNARFLMLTNKPASYTDYWNSSANFLNLLTSPYRVNWPIKNALRAGETLASTPIGVATPQFSTDIFAGCEGEGYAKTSKPCYVRTDLTVFRQMPGVNGRQSVGTCYGQVGSTTYVDTNCYSGNCGTSPTPTGPTGTFGPTVTPPNTGGTTGTGGACISNCGGS